MKKYFLKGCDKFMKQYIKDFFKEEDGMEFLQVAVIVALSALLITVVAYLFTKIGNKIGEAGDAVDSIDANPNVNQNPYNNVP